MRPDAATRRKYCITQIALFGSWLPKDPVRVMHLHPCSPQDNDPESTTRPLTHLVRVQIRFF